MSEHPPDVVTARAIRDLRITLLGAAGATLLLGLAGLAVLLVVGGSADRALPMLSLLAVGQATAVAATGAAAVGLFRVLRPPADDRASPACATTGTARALRLLVRILLVVLVAATAGWALARGGEAVGALAGALVSAQLAVVLTALARRLDA